MFLHAKTGTKKIFIAFPYFISATLQKNTYLFQLLNDLGSTMRGQSGWHNAQLTIGLCPNPLNPRNQSTNYFIQSGNTIAQVN